MNQEVDRIVDGAIRQARSRQAVVVDLPHVALAIRDLAGRDGTGLFRPDAIEAVAATADSLPTRDQTRDGSWSAGVVPVSAAFRSWLRSMESLSESDDTEVVLERARKGLAELLGPGDPESVIQEGRARSVREPPRSNESSVSGQHPPYVFEFTPEVLRRFEPYVGNEDLVALTLGVLARRRKRHPVLVGAAGVGKTALVVEIARRLMAGRVPDRLKGSRVFQVDLGTAVAGTRYRGDFEERMAWLSRQLLEDPKSIFFIDEIQLVLNVGSGEGGIDAASLLKPALSSGVGALVGATTRNQARQLERDAPLARRLVFIPVAEPSIELTRVILETHAKTLEEEYSIEIPHEVVEAALRAGSRLRPHRHLPDAALDILDLAASLFAVDRPEEKVLSVDATDSVTRFVTEGLSHEKTKNRLLRVADKLRDAAAERNGIKR